MLLRLLRLIALASFAVAQPLLDLVGRTGEFLVAHRTDRADVLVLAVALLVLPGLVLWSLEVALHTIRPAWSRALHLTWVGLLVLLATLGMLVHVAPRSTWLAAGGAICTAAFLTWVYHRSARASSFVGLLAVAPLVFGAGFLMQPDVQALLRPATHRGAGTASGATRLALSPARGPVIVLVFDELPLSSLLDGFGEIDRVRFPAFAALARQSLWARGFSTSASRTLQSLATLVTGRYASMQDVAPTAVSHPDNLFSLLEPTHRLNVVETRSSFHRGSGAAALPGNSRSCLVEDLAVVYAHLVSPARIRDSLVPIDQDWACWLRAVAPPARATPSKQGPRPSDMLEKLLLGGPSTLDATQLLRFARSIAREHRLAGPNPASLHFAHVILPHSPWRFTPSGTFYSPNATYGLKYGRWDSEPWWSLEAYQRHLLQVQFTDRLLGMLVEELRDAGLYDEALLVVTADHGVGFWPGESQRALRSTRHPEDIVSVPLFIKRPQQHTARKSGRVSESIDLLPTLADALGVGIPWNVDGCSLYDPACPPRKERRVAMLNKRNRIGERRFGPNVVYRQATLKRKARFFGSGKRPYGLYRFGRWAKLCGRNVDGLDRRTESAGFVRSLGRRGVRVIAEVALRRPAREMPQVAVVLNGHIETIVPAPPTGPGLRRVVALLPEDRMADGNEELSLYLMGGTPDAPSLAPLVQR